MAKQTPWRDAPLIGDALYGDRQNLRRYRDTARDEHRRFGMEYEWQQRGGLPFQDTLTEYDRFDADLTQGRHSDDERRHATEGGYAYGIGSHKPAYLREDRAIHRGRGPSGYQRSDQRIYEDVCERLMEDDRVDASEIQVSVTNGEVTLSGTLRSRNAKRRATDLAEDVSGVKDVHNQIRVTDDQVWPPERARD